jgi:hypothetical protein
MMSRLEARADGNCILAHHFGGFSIMYLYIYLRAFVLK